MKSTDGEPLLHASAYYTLNEFPQTMEDSEALPNEATAPEDSGAHPVPQSPRWLTYKGKAGAGKNKHVVLIAAEQEYRSEQAMPMLAKVLSTHHGFDCTVLFSVNEKGEVDPTLPAPFKDKTRRHNIPGLKHLEKADCVISVSYTHLTLPTIYAV